MRGLILPTATTYLMPVLLLIPVVKAEASPTGCSVFGKCTKAFPDGLSSLAISSSVNSASSRDRCMITE